MEMSAYLIVIKLVVKSSIDRVYLRHLYDILAVRLTVRILENKTRLGLLYVLIVVLVQDHVHINMMIVMIWTTLMMHTLTWLMVYFILHLVQAVLILTQLEFVLISHILKVLLRVLPLVVHLVLIPRNKVTVRISLPCLGLWCFPNLATLNHLPALKLNIGLSSKPSLLLFHFLNYLSLLLLLFDSLVITPLRLCTGILHLWFLLLVLIISFGWWIISWFLFLWRFLSWLRTSVRTFFHLFGRLLLYLYFFNSFFLLDFLQLHLLFLVNYGHNFSYLLNW